MNTIMSLDELMESGLPQLCVWLRTNPMCGRFTFQPTEAVYARFGISNRLDSLMPRYNIAPGQMVPIIIAHSPRQIVLMREQHRHQDCFERPRPPKVNLCLEGLRRTRKHPVKRA
jgi:putative SOS response-associated peptidase YedK